jgi:DNA primase
MTKFFTRHQLYKMRNNIPLTDVLATLEWPHKTRDGRVCFVCPQCSESLTAINPRTNLGRCFRCETNFNAIDLVMLIKNDDFVAAVHFLQERFPESI